MNRLIKPLYEAIGEAIVDIGALELEVVHLEAQINSLKRNTDSTPPYKAALEIYSQCGDWGKIEFIKALRTATGLGMQECKDIADMLKF